MRSIVRMGMVAVAAGALATALHAGAAGPSCTGCGGACVPRCRATWEEEKTKDVDYQIRCEYACARGRDSWHAPDPECRCHPPCGNVYVKKRLYKSEGEETVKRVPRYNVEMVSAAPCGCADCRREHSPGWNPLGILSWLHLR